MSRQIRLIGTGLSSAQPSPDLRQRFAKADKAADILLTALSTLYDQLGQYSADLADANQTLIKEHAAQQALIGQLADARTQLMQSEKLWARLEASIDAA